MHCGVADVKGVKMEWSNDGELLAIAGHVRLPNQDCHNELRFYRRSTRLQMSLVLPSQVYIFTSFYLTRFFADSAVECWYNDSGSS